MKKNRIYQISVSFFLVFIMIISSILTSCKNNGNEDDTSVSPPETLESTDITENGDTTIKENDPPKETYEITKYSGTQKIDYSEYLPEKVISDTLIANSAVAIAAGAHKAFDGKAFIDIENTALERDYRTLTVNPSSLSAITKSSIPEGTETVAAAASALGKKYIEYDSKLIVFYESETPVFNIIKDTYSLEYLYLMLTNAEKSELENALLTLPTFTSNNISNSTYYSAPDLHLGIQTTMYNRLMGDSKVVGTGPAIVAGEGKNEVNHTLVRVFNKQQSCISQFLAFPPSVTGGVQVSSIKTADGQTYIATAAYNNASGLADKVRIFTTDGSLYMEIKPENVKAPFIISGGKFISNDKNEEVLLVSSSSPTDGKIYTEVYSISSAEQLKKTEINADFAKADENISISVRSNSDTPDSLIIYFTQSNVAYEGTLDNSFNKISDTLPHNTSGVYASSDENKKYVFTLKETDDTTDRSLISYIDKDGQLQTIDVGERENIFYSTLSEKTDEGYVRYASFQHLRTDLSSTLINKIQGNSDSKEIYEILHNNVYSDWSTGVYTNGLTDADSRVFLEPCFTHRLNAVPFNNALMKYTDAINGESTYASIGKSGEYIPYLELGSSFHVGTYADGIPEMQKWRMYPLRSFLQRVSVEFRGENGNPEKMVGISPVHEQEINVEGSVGDYNIYMVKGFAEHLLELYGSVQNINERFGTNFKSADEIDPPRDGAFGERGEWDKYKGDYFKQWTLYNRYIVNKRIMEAYREALIAGFPPESISAHQIPEGDAVAGFLGQANTRLSPIDVVLSCGTAYGGTRYATFYNDRNNFIAIASNAGHHSMVLGEYGSLNISMLTAYKQLQYLWKNGVRMIHYITFNDDQQKAERDAALTLGNKNNLPRPGYTGGSRDVASYVNGNVSYDIIQIGEGTDKEGLLKSVKKDGTWEGTVYLVPFHSHINITEISEFANIDNGTCTTGVIHDLQHGDQIEIKLTAKSSDNGKIKIQVFNDGYLLDDASVEYTVSNDESEYRYVFSNQISPEGIEIKVSFEDGVQASDLCATVQTESIGRKFVDRSNTLYKKSVTHVGGVTFDIIEE